MAGNTCSVGWNKKLLCSNINYSRMNKDLRILVLEDMEDDLEIIEYMLEKAGMHFHDQEG